MTEESTASKAKSTTWKLPDGIEDHLEIGLVKASAGIAVGGAIGLLLFRSGKGWRTASVATGLGMAVGSTYTRIQGGRPPPQRMGNKSSVSSNSTL
jgi:Domain of unknown function (DUF543)